MIKTLTAGAIGVSVSSIADGIAKAKKAGFQGYEFNVAWLADLIDAEGDESALEEFNEAGVLPTVFGLPVEWRRDEATWKEGLGQLERLAAAAKAVGCTRTATWVMPCSNDRELEPNRVFHIERFKPIADILAAHGISLGLEFIGPKTLRDTQKHPFIYKMEDMLEMGKEIGPNVGLLLDAFHWHTSHGTVEQLKALKPSDIVYVHLNDAQLGLSPDEQIDGARCLPGETGVIDLKGFIQSLKAIGYTGPAAVEPFKKELADLPSDMDRLRVVSESLEKVLAY